jgi:serine/threonine protein kinase
VDFGLANLREAADETRLTAAHQFVGTVTYASPEQMRGGALDGRSDIYSLGVVVFEMLTGRVPFPGTDPFAVVTAHLTTPAPAPSSVHPDLPRWIDLVVTRALAKNPDDRWPQIADFGDALASGGERRSTSAAVVAPRSLLATYDMADRVGPGRLGSEVFRGSHRVLGHSVAIRILRRAPDRNWDAVRARFLREARTMQVAHPSIIQVRDYGEEGDLVYVVTDFIEGPSLRELITTAGALEWVRLRPLLAQLVDAVRTLHKRKGLLCGLTPDIVRVTTDEDGERLLISSAGIWQAQDLLATLHEQTLRGGMLADPELRYVAPELLTGRTADARSDVFTMAVLAYELATATLPYNGASMPALLGSMLAGRPADPREAQPKLPDHAAEALLKALRPAPEERFASAKDFGAALLGAG